MNTLHVRILASNDADENTAVYRSDSTEPARLAMTEDSDLGDGATYETLLDLPAQHRAVWPPETLFVVGIDLAAGHEADFEDWYNTEHLPALADVPGVNRAMRFRRSSRSASDPDDYPAYLALYDITQQDIAGNADWQRAVNTPWTERLRPHFTARWRGGYRLE